MPGRRPPLLVTAEAVKGMQAGAVLVDLAASSLGGNIEGSVADQTMMTENGVRIIGAGNLPAQMPTAASTAYSHNIAALLAELIRDGALTIDPADEIQAGVVVTHQGKVIHPAVAALLGPSTEEAADDHRPDVRYLHVRAGHPGRLRSHHQGAVHLAHAADVGVQRHSRHRHHRRRS